MSRSADIIPGNDPHLRRATNVLVMSQTVTNGTNLCSICYSYSVYWGLLGTGIPIYNNKWLDNTRDHI